jgi:putative thioredoxin
MAIDVTDETFQAEVIERSHQVPVIIDLWAPWCGPCRTLGPILEKVTGETDGKVIMVKVNVDENPQISAAFGVQSIPLVVAIKNGEPVDGFLGAQPEGTIRTFISGLLPTEEETQIDTLIAEGNEPALRAALALSPGHDGATVALAELLVAEGRGEEALAELAKIPETPEVRHIAAEARLSLQPVEERPSDDYDQQLASLLPLVKTDDEARQKFIDLLEVMGAEDERTGPWRRKLTTSLF